MTNETMDEDFPPPEDIEQSIMIPTIKNTDIQLDKIKEVKDKLAGVTVITHNGEDLVKMKMKKMNIIDDLKLTD